MRLEMRTILINSVDKVHILITKRINSWNTCIEDIQQLHYISSFQVTFRLPVGKAAPGGHPEIQQLCFTTRTTITRKMEIKW